MHIKTEEEIEKMRQGGKILSDILRLVVKMARPGITTEDLDRFAERRILGAGGLPAFKGYTTRYASQPFPSTLCTSLNAEVVHAPAVPKRTLRDGDLLSIDIGMRYPAVGGLYTDMATTVAIGKVSKEALRLMEVTHEALKMGIRAVREGASIARIGRTVQDYVEREGFSVVRDLVGHGVGHAVHEDPYVPNYYDARLEEVVIPESLPLAIEPMVAAGGPAVRTAEDGWTVVTSDGRLSAHFEATVVLGKKGVEILTPIIFEQRVVPRSGKAGPGSRHPKGFLGIRRG